MNLLLANVEICVGVCFMVGGLSILIPIVTAFWKVAAFMWRFLVGEPDTPALQSRSVNLRCARRGCGELNWNDSRFCRRCGNALTMEPPRFRQDSGAARRGRKDDVDVRG